MKIGILTFQRAYNYGAVLQAYALQRAISKLGADSEIIDYINSSTQEKIKLFRYNSKYSLKNNILKFFKDFYRVGKQRKFNYFLKTYTVLSFKPFYTFDEMVELDKQDVYDSYIVGSDQVWNIGNNGGDKTFLLAFVKNNKKRNSYAASFGSCKLNKEQTELYAKELSHFNIITVREENALDSFPFLIENDAHVVLDPTLLLDKEDYLKIISKRLVKRRYAFLYTVPKADRLRSFAKEYCKKNGLILIDIKKSYKAFVESAPEDFLSFIANAEMVFTNSFHGTAFSIIMERQFITEVNSPKTKNVRSYDLLKLLGLLNRDMNDDFFNAEQKIDYFTVRDRLKLVKENSYLYLRKIVLDE